MLITRAGGSVAKTVAQLDSSGTSQVCWPSFFSCSTQLTNANPWFGVEQGAVHSRDCTKQHRV